MLFLSASALSRSTFPLLMAIAVKESMILTILLTISSDNDFNLSQSFSFTSLLFPTPSIMSDSIMDWSTIGRRTDARLLTSSFSATA